jgi:hypothetical protein
MMPRVTSELLALALAVSGARGADAQKTVARGDPEAQMECRTNNSEYTIGEPIYVTVTVRVSTGSKPLSGRWFVPHCGFSYKLLYSEDFDAHEPYVELGCSGRPRLADQPSRVSPAESITTTFEVLYAQEWQPYEINDWPGVSEEDFYYHFWAPQKHPLTWRLLFPWGAPVDARPGGEYQLKVEQDCAAAGAGPIAITSHSNRFRIVEPSNATPRDLFGFLLYAMPERTNQISRRIADTPEYKELADGEKRLKEGLVPPQLRALYAHTAMQGCKNHKRWKGVTTWCKQILETYPGYPLQPEVEFDLSMAYLADGQKEQAERTMRDLIERVGLSRLINPVLRARPDKRTPELAAAEDLYQRIAADTKKRGPRPPFKLPFGEPPDTRMEDIDGLDHGITVPGRDK